MRERCVEVATQLITDLIEELRFFNKENPNHTAWLEDMNALDRLGRRIRSEYARLHPNEKLPGITGTHEPQNHSETSTRHQER